MATTEDQPADRHEELLREHLPSKHTSLVIDTHRSNEILRNQPSNTTFHTALVIPDSLGDEAIEQPAESSERARIDRTDSGYGDDHGRTGTSSPESSHTQSSGTSPTPLLQKAALRHRGDLPSDFRRGRRRTKSATFTSTPKETPPAVPPSTSHQTGYRRYSYSRRPSSKPNSRPGSKHSNSGQRSYNIYSKSNSASTSRRSSFNLSERRSESPLAFHYKSSQLFQSLGTALAHHHTDPGVHSTVGLVCSSQHSPRRSVSTSEPHHPVDHTLSHHRDSEASHNDPPSPVSPPAPTTTISWMSMATRRREYAEIDKSTRGFRGFWARWAPKWCSYSRHRPFYNSEKDDDVGSVRRYRLDLPEDEGGVAKNRAPTDEEPAHEVTRTWSCFSLRNNTVRPKSVGKQKSYLFSSATQDAEAASSSQEKEPEERASPNLSRKDPISNEKPMSEESSEHKVTRSWSCFNLRNRPTQANVVTKKKSGFFSGLLGGPEDLPEDQSKPANTDGLAKKKSVLFAGLLGGPEDETEDQNRSSQADGLVRKRSYLFSMGCHCGLENAPSDEIPIEPARIHERPWTSRM
ncbi:MAG: hypothetical protein M1819_001050 [Sarea resinae]|nr:MAG: hypothetical protein M1819_001050 [Sarea resinae]